MTPTTPDNRKNRFIPGSYHANPRASKNRPRRPVLSGIAAVEAAPVDLPLRYVASSRNARVRGAALEEVARWVGLTAWHTRPLPRDRSGLVLTQDGLRLAVPGAGRGFWPAGMLHRRTARGADDRLIAAIDLPQGARVLDATFGLGHDALLMARHGWRVLGCEGHAALLWYAQDGVRRHDPVASRRIQVRCADHRALLAQRPAVDAVYFDPMFPRKRASRNNTMEPLRGCAIPDPIAPATLRAALDLCGRVILKLAPYTQAPLLPGWAPARRVDSKRMFFAVYDTPAG